MTAPGPLGDYLRARRERLQPSDVGLVVGGGKRRVPGLRREEVAVLAGVSTDYYLRLERGRDARPSDQVLDALARALRLDEVASEHLHLLARPMARTGSLEGSDTVQDSTRWLIESWPLTSAVVHSKYVDVLASNTLARSLNPNFRVGVNSVVSLFTDPAEHRFHDDWEALAARSVALLRISSEARVGDARLDALVAAGSAASPLFREFWERQEVRRIGDGVHALHHPLVGELRLTFLRLPLVGTGGQSLFLYYAEPGSPSEAAMRRLAGVGGGPAGPGSAGVRGLASRAWTSIWRARSRSSRARARASGWLSRGRPWPRA
ncbi:helix-turn-helix transcriptional regulator [Cellulomonas sp. P5_C5]